MNKHAYVEKKPQYFNAVQSMLHLKRLLFYLLGSEIHPHKN